MSVLTDIHLESLTITSPYFCELSTEYMNEFVEELSDTSIQLIHFEDPTASFTQRGKQSWRRRLERNTEGAFAEIPIDAGDA